VPHNGVLYELDGLQEGPISYGACTDENWVEMARTEIQKRIEKYAASEIRFNLLAVIKDRADLAKETIVELESKVPMEEN
jgi:ubiquitin carboxyl-terminal hydrolase L5